MAEPYVGEIRMFAGNFAPSGWAFCDGQLLPISENDALFALIGTTYGGDGQETFALPDLRGRLPVHHGTGSGLSTRQLGEQSGVEQVTVGVQELPSHTHSPLAGGTATTPSPQGAVWAAWSSSGYATDPPQVSMHPAALGLAGGSQPHSNLMPSLCINHIIALYGIFPSQA